MTMLSVSNLTKTFGALRALHDVGFQVAEKEIFGIIGPNGAGKTTLFNVLVGLEKPDGGEVYFRGKTLKNLRPHEVCRAGLTKTSQIVRPFLTFSVRENILVALMFGRNFSKKKAEMETGAILNFLHLEDVQERPAGALSLPQRRRVELGRALGTGAEMILMDENLAGLNARELAEGMEIIRDIRRQGKTVVIVEHIMQAIIGLCDRAVVLSYGEKIAEGPPADVCKDERVVEAYLGSRVCSR